MKNSNLEMRKIKSLKFLYEVNSNGTIFRNAKSKRQLKIVLDKHHSDKGYYVTFVHLGGRSPESRYVRVMLHRAVAECWLGDCPEGYQVDHIDRNPHNNDYRNLRYVTHSEQMKNRDHTNISKRGRQNLRKACRERMKPVCISKGGKTQYFESHSACARYMEAEIGCVPHRVLNRMAQKRRSIYGYDVTYDIAETVHTGFTKQETVQK